VRSEEEFWESVDIKGDDDCWRWKGLGVGGYGRVYFHGRQWYVHRLAWFLANDRPIPKGMYVLHTCDNRACVNPKHLMLGTQEENMRQRSERGRAPVGEDSWAAKLTENQVREIRRIHSEGKLSMKEISQIVGVSYSSIKQVISRKVWKHVD
jgi:hypothetical protein